MIFNAALAREKIKKIRNHWTATESWKSISRDIGIHVDTLNDFMNSSQKVSEAVQQKILKYLELDEIE